MDWRRFLGELQRRNVYRVAVTYAVVGWVLIQIATQVSPFFEIPTWAVRVVVLLLVLGFPVALFLLSGVRAVQLASEGEVPAELRDLDCDGKVSPIEWLRGGIDFRLRDSQLVPGCRDVVMVKTGVPLTVRCAQPPMCRLARDLPR